jgi:hypothetical protein
MCEWRVSRTVSLEMPAGKGVIVVKTVRFDIFAVRRKEMMGGGGGGSYLGYELFRRVWLHRDPVNGSDVSFIMH